MARCQRHHLAVVVIAASGAALIAGFVIPVGTIVPSFGSPIANTLLSYWFPEELAPQSKTLLGGIWNFFERGQYFLGILLFNFTVVFPITKLLLLLILAVTHSQAQVNDASRYASRWRLARSRCLGVLSHVGHWSMLDVLVVAMLVASFARFPLGTRILPEPGLYWFSLSVVLSIVAVQLVKSLDRDSQVA